MSRFRFSIFILVLLCSPIESARAQEAEEPAHDYLFPGHGEVTVGAATGLPFVGMSEVGVGACDWFAVGAIVGATPRVLGVGIRPRVALTLPAGFRLMLVAPTLYYPKTNSPGGAPWFLTRPTIHVERVFAERWRATLGGGMFLAAPQAVLFEGQSAEDLGGAYGTDPDAFTGGMWGTMNAGFAYAAGKRWSFFFEGSLIFGAQGLAGSDWVGGPPFAISTGVAVTLS